MEVKVQVPDEIAKHLGDAATIPRLFLESLATEAYRSQKLSRLQVSVLLGLDYWQTEDLLTRYDAKRLYTLQDLEVDRAHFLSSIKNDIGCR